MKADDRRLVGADREAPRKQRHTARRVWQRLVDEHRAQVGESTVRRYVADARRRQPAVLAEVKVPQTHPPGAEAEVDFGQVSFFLAGVQVEGWMFVLRLSASGRGFHRVYLNQAQQAFFDGHVRALEHMGGVPGRIRYDNLKPAVVRVLKGRDRAESERLGSSLCDRITGSTRSSVSPVSKAPMRRAASRVRSAGSAAATWSLSLTSTRSPS